MLHCGWTYFTTTICLDNVSDYETNVCHCNEQVFINESANSFVFSLPSGLSYYTFKCNLNVEVHILRYLYRTMALSIYCRFFHGRYIRNKNMILFFFFCGKVGKITVMTIIFRKYSVVDTHTVQVFTRNSIVIRFLRLFSVAVLKICRFQYAYVLQG